MQAQVNAALFRPLRLNFAQVCIWCAERWCESAECVAKHERSTWAVCEECDGGATDDCRCGVHMRVRRGRGLAPLRREGCQALPPVIARASRALLGADVPGGGPVTAHLSVVEIPVEKRPRVLPWCVWCDSALLLADHDACLSAMDLSAWTPCLTCHGGRVDTDGTSCEDCRGIGFWEMHSLVAMAEGYTNLAPTDDADLGRYDR